MKINDHLYLVGGGDYGFNLSGRLDANSYVIDTGEGLWMIDAGFDGGEQVVANIVAEGLEPRDITRCSSPTTTRTMPVPSPTCARRSRPSSRSPSTPTSPTRCAPATRRTTGCAGRRASTSTLRSSTSSRATSISSSWAARATAPDVHAHRHRHARPLPGHICYFVTGGAGGYLFSGDHVFWGGKIILQNVGDSSVQEYAKSMNALLDYDFSALLPGHLAFSMINGRRHVELAASQFNKIGLPANLL